MKMRKLLLTALMAPLAGAWAQPVDNPYRTHYSPSGNHWTDALKWDVVTDASTLPGIVADDNMDDSTGIANAIQTVHEAGGGVLYFPPGVYNINGYITLKSGVILRGQTPTGITSAKVVGYNPSTKFIFPKYVLDTLANGGKGNPNSSAFKGIVSEFDCSNIGLVNIDVNRAYISFQPDYNTALGAPFTTPQPIQQNRNIIVYGIRSNNAAIPDPGIPRKDTPQKQWQRYCWRFTTNIDVTAAGNCVVANCRANGEPELDETYNQPGYVYNRRNTTDWLIHPTGDQTRFDYNEHYGISVNRKKKKKNPVTGAYSVYGYALLATPETEPSLFSPGIEIRDNWIFNNSRVSLMGAGNGLILDGNISRMDPTKEDVTKYIVAPDGWRTLQGATTLENRAIDFSGWNCTVSNNDFTVSRSKVGGYLTTDGEGILVQECCGGSTVNDYRILNNIANGRYIGLYKMRTLTNVEVKGNNMGGGPIWLWANTNNDDYYLNNVHVKKNTGVSQISMTGSKGGTNVVVDSNTSSSPDRSIGVPCYAIVGSNNSGFKEPTYNSNGGVSCVPTANFPTVAIIEPASDLVFCDVPGDSLTLRFKLTGGIPAQNTLEVYNGAEVLVGNIKVGSDSTAMIKVKLSATGEYLYNLTVATTQTPTVQIPDAVTAYSTIRRVQRKCEYNGPIKNLAESLFAGEVSVYPNPGSGEFTVAGVGEFATLAVYNYMGKVVYTGSGSGFDISHQPAGMYFVEIAEAGAKKLIRVIKN